MYVNVYKLQFTKNGKSSFADIIILQYPFNGETQSGLIRVNLKLILEENVVEYQSIEYGDGDIQSYVENNPSVLAKIDSLRNKI